jgi:hypothetical protein
LAVGVVVSLLRLISSPANSTAPGQNQSRQSFVLSVAQGEYCGIIGVSFDSTIPTQIFIAAISLSSPLASLCFLL